MAGKVLVGESPNDEENGEAHESHKLNWLTPDSVDGGNGHPVTWNSTSTDENAVTSSKVVEDLVNVWSSTVANGGKHSGRVETETVELEVGVSVKFDRIEISFYSRPHQARTKNPLFRARFCHSSTCRRS